MRIASPENAADSSWLLVETRAVARCVRAGAFTRMADVVARGECVLPALLRLSGSSLKDGFAAKVKTAQLRL